MDNPFDLFAPLTKETVTCACMDNPFDLFAPVTLAPIEPEVNQSRPVQNGHNVLYSSHQLIGSPINVFGRVG